MQHTVGLNDGTVIRALGTFFSFPCFHCHPSSPFKRDVRGFLGGRGVGGGNGRPVEQ
jgi:hypothetical protein